MEVRGCCREDLRPPGDREAITSETETSESWTKAVRGPQESTVRVVEGFRLHVTEARRVWQSAVVTHRQERGQDRLGHFRDPSQSTGQLHPAQTAALPQSQLIYNQP